MTGATSTGTPSQPQTTQVAPPWRPLKSSGRGGAWGCGEGSRTSPLPVAYLPLPRRGPCWLYPTGPGKGRRAFGRLPPWPPWSRGSRQRAGRGARRPAAAERLRMQVRLPARRRWPCPRAARQGSPSGGRGSGESARAPRAECEGRKGGGHSGTQARGAAARPAPLRPRLTRPPRPRAAPSGPAAAGPVT